MIEELRGEVAESQALAGPQLGQLLAAAVC
jgi:hypothetical protein